jgi:mannose-6-phosphate isomerase-like protein (cupin superfamily)
MHHILHRADQTITGRTVTFEGEPYGAGVSFFVVDNGPGEGPEPHLHPYSETFIVRSGQARIIAGQEEVEAGPGDIIVVGPDTRHGFTNPGPGRLEIICIHAAPRMNTTWLDERPPSRP